jgi:hypothetical protein
MLDINTLKGRKIYFWLTVSKVSVHPGGESMAEPSHFPHGIQEAENANV